MVYKRGRYYQYRFEFEGKEYRKSTKQGNKEVAQKMEQDHRDRLTRGEDMPKTRTSAKKFADAADDFRDTKGNWAKKTKDVHNSSMKHLKPFFGEMLLKEISNVEIGKYQTMRRKQKGKNGLTTGRTINIEIGTIIKVLDHYDMWARIKKKYKKLDENEDVGRALSESEVIKLLDAAKKSASRSLFPALVVSINTGLRNEELRLLRWKQVNFENREITVGKSKTKKGRGRVVPLNDWALEVLREWHSEFPKAQLDHYVFPSQRYALVGRKGLYGGIVKLGEVIPTRPVSTWKTAWTTIRKNTGIECRWHDLRHTFASALGAGGTRDQTMKAVLGWAHSAMIDRYSHVSNEDRRIAVATVPRPMLVQ
jgi:integrase